MNPTLEILKKHNITYFSADANGKITINGNLYLNLITEVHRDFLKDTIINGDLYLYSLERTHKDFLKYTTINGYVDVDSLEEKDKEILRNNIIKIQN